MSTEAATADGLRPRRRGSGRFLARSPGTQAPPVEVLVVDDELPMRDTLTQQLQAVGFVARGAGTARQAHAEVQRCRPDVLLLDWELPDYTGLELLHTLKDDRRTRSMPVILLTPHRCEDDTVRALDEGADDSLAKPLSIPELASRIRAVLRGLDSHAEGDLQFGPLCIDVERREIRAQGIRIELGSTEYRMLEFLMRNPDRAFHRDELLDAVWGQGAFVEERTVDVHVLRVRKALAAVHCKHFLQTIRGFGYRFSLTRYSQTTGS